MLIESLKNEGRERTCEQVNHVGEPRLQHEPWRPPMNMNNNYIGNRH